MITGGDFFEMTWSNEDVGSGRYFGKAGEDFMLDLGGYETASDKGNIDAAGNFMNIKTTKPWMHSHTIAWDKTNGARRELESLQALSNSFKPTKFTFSGIDKVIYAGVGSVVEAIEANGNKAVISVKVMGSGILQQIP